MGGFASHRAGVVQRSQISHSKLIPPSSFQHPRSNSLLRPSGPVDVLCVCTQYGWDGQTEGQREDVRAFAVHCARAPSNLPHLHFSLPLFPCLLTLSLFSLLGLLSPPSIESSLSIHNPISRSSTLLWASPRFSVSLEIVVPSSIGTFQFPLSIGRQAFPRLTTVRP